MPFARSLLAAGSDALGRLDFGALKNDAGQTEAGAPSLPLPIPAIFSAVHLPADHYRHTDAPTEWWWHVGTLKTAEGRVFGFEINTASYTDDRNVGFSQVMLTDVKNEAHYQRTAGFAPPQGYDPLTWAEPDVTKDWHVGLGSISNCLSVIDVITPGSGYGPKTRVEIIGGGGSQAVAYPQISDKDGAILGIAIVNPGRGYTSTPIVMITDPDNKGTGATAKAMHSYVTMDAAWGDPTQNMAITALLVDVDTGIEVKFDLKMSQKGPPFRVLGFGVLPILPSDRGTHLQTNNYYYSLTRLHAHGTITVGVEPFHVTGVTWMDHQVGFFGSSGNPVKWILQDMQLDNGWCISNFSLSPDDLQAGLPVSSVATLQDPLGTVYVDLQTSITPKQPWTSPNSLITYFMELDVTIPSVGATLTVTSLIDSQEFYLPVGSVYEGVASVSGTFQGKEVSGTAWNEQALPPPTTA